MKEKEEKEKLDILKDRLITEAAWLWSHNLLCQGVDTGKEQHIISLRG